MHNRRFIRFLFKFNTSRQRRNHQPIHISHKRKPELEDIHIKTSILSLRLKLRMISSPILRLASHLSMQVLIRNLMPIITRRSRLTSSPFLLRLLQFINTRFINLIHPQSNTIKILNMNLSLSTRIRRMLTKIIRRVHMRLRNLHQILNLLKSMNSNPPTRSNLKRNQLITLHKLRNISNSMFLTKIQKRPNLGFNTFLIRHLRRRNNMLTQTRLFLRHFLIINRTIIKSISVLICLPRHLRPNRMILI